MKLSEMVPNLTPEQLANCEIKIAVNWADQKAKLAVVDSNNVLVHEKRMNVTAAPIEPARFGTQGEYWQVHHNPWLD